jgi:hypothetical protein
MCHDQPDRSILQYGRHGIIDKNGLVLLGLVEIFISDQIADDTCNTERNPQPCLQNIDTGYQAGDDFKPGLKWHILQFPAGCLSLLQSFSQLA